MRCKLCLKVVGHPSKSSRELQICGDCNKSNPFNYVSYPEIPTIRQVNVNGKRLRMIKHICVIPNKDKQAEGEDVLNKTLSEGYSVIRDIDTPPSIVYVLGLYDQGSDSDD